MSATSKPVNILIADDDKDDCMFFKEALEEIPIKVELTAVHDGEELMAHLAARTVTLPDALFLDLNMPRKNGFECLQEIKSNVRLKKLPVIIYSTSYDEWVADGLYKSGAHHYIRKPGNFNELKKDIHHALTMVMSENNIQPPKEKFLISKLRTPSSGQ